MSPTNRPVMSAIMDKCVVCGHPTQGVAIVGGDRVCGTTCFELAQQVEWWVPWRWENAKRVWALRQARERHPTNGGRA